MVIGRLRRDERPAGDLGVAHAARHKPGDVELPVARYGVELLDSASAPLGVSRSGAATVPGDIRSDHTMRFRPLASLEETAAVQIRRDLSPASRFPSRFAPLALAVFLCFGTAVVGAPTAAASPASLQAREWWISRLALPAVWKLTKGAGMTIAVVDSGVDTSVGDLRGAVVPGFSVGTTASPNRAYDAIGHGTAMAVDMVGRGTSPGILGVAPEAKIMPVYLPDSSPPTLVAGLRRLSAMAHPPQVVNMSFGAAGPCVPELQAAVRTAVDKGLILVASAGNTGNTDNDNQFPSNCKGVVAVGAFDVNGKPWSQTQRQPYVSLGGPGVNIVAYDKSLRIGTANGTSDSAAIVSAQIALVTAHFPKLTSRQIVARVFATASHTLYPGPGYGRSGDTLGFGPALVHHALTDKVPLDAPNPVYDDLAKVSRTSSAPTSSPAVASPSAPSSSDVAVPGSPAGSLPAASSGGSSGSGNSGVVIAAIAGGVVLVGAIAFVVYRRSRAARQR